MMKWLRNALAGLSRLGRNKALLLIAATTITLTSAASGTLAWLVDQTPPVTNTFTYGDINISLTETDSLLDGDDDPLTNEYRMVPGASIQKDPVVCVHQNSENCWLFVKMDKQGPFDEFLTYEIEAGWMELPGTEGIYYQAVDRAEVQQDFPVLKDHQIAVLGSVTKEMLNRLDEDGVSQYPQLTITAYAVQRDEAIVGIDEAKAAWGLIQSQSIQE